LGQKSGLPAYYRKLPGNLTDVMTVSNLIAGVGVLDKKKVKLVMDRGYDSEKNLSDLMRPHYTFIIGAKISLKFIQAQIAGGHADFDRREHSPSDTGLFRFFALLSNRVEDPLDALRIYRSKDMIEKAFSDLKDRLNRRRTSVSSEENLEGKLFLQFVALTYVSYVKRTMDATGLFRNKTRQELIDDLDVIEKYQVPERPPYCGEITDKQRKLYAKPGVIPPA
jgi:transposase